MKYWGTVVLYQPLTDREIQDFFSKYEKRLYNYIRSIMNKDDEVSDIYQEVWIAFIERVKKEGFIDESRAQYWLLRTAKYHCYKVFRLWKRFADPKKENDQREYDDYIKTIPDKDLFPLEQYIKGETAQQLRHAITDLPEIYRQPVIQFYYQNNSIRQIANALHITESTAKVRLVRARGQIKERLEAMGYEQQL